MTTEQGLGVRVVFSSTRRTEGTAQHPHRLARCMLTHGRRGRCMQSCRLLSHCLLSYCLLGDGDVIDRGSEANSGEESARVQHLEWAHQRVIHEAINGSSRRQPRQTS